MSPEEKSELIILEIFVQNKVGFFDTKHVDKIGILTRMGKIEVCSFARKKKCERFLQKDFESF